MPKVSVVIPTHNRPEFLKKALVSVLGQTYDDFEIIVVDDGLEKRADKIVNDFHDNRIKYIQHKEGRGGSVARNTGIKMAQGEYVAFLDDDDEWFKNKLEQQVKLLEASDDKVGFCYTGVERKVDDKIIINKVFSGEINYFEIALRHFKGALTSTLLVKKEVFKRCGLFDEDLPSHQEAELIIRFSKEYKAIGIDKPLIRMFGDSNHKHIGGDLNKRTRGMEMVLEKYKDEYKKRPAVLAQNLFRLALFYRDNGNKKKARENFQKALIIKFNLRYLVHYLLSLII